MSGRYDVIVIGAGPNGLATAAKLAQAGRRVVVVERRDRIGGLAATDEFHPGFHGIGMFHHTSSVRPRAVRDLGLERHGLTLRDRASVFASDYRRFRKYLESLRGILEDFIDGPPVDPVDIESNPLVPTLKRALRLRRLGGAGMMELLRLPPMSAADWLGEWFEDDLLKATLALPAVAGTYTGPRSPASNFNLLLCEAARGHREIVGGAPALVRALDAAARAAGAEIRTDAAVEQIRVDSGGVGGVRLENGEEIAAARVAASCDPRTTFALLARGAAPQRLEERIATYRMRGTTAQVLFALRAPLAFTGAGDAQVEHARLAPGLDAIERAFDAVKYRRCSDEPVLDVHVASASSEGVAPDGQAVASVLVHFAPHDLDGGWDDAARDRLGDVVVQTLERHAPGIGDTVIARQVLAPTDIESRYGCTGGHWQHGEHALDQLLLRPAPEAAGYRTVVSGLFLCGSGSHPGGGLTCAPGLRAAETMLSA
jgi:phytoene dehydrogenase-like protein